MSEPERALPFIAPLAEYMQRNGYSGVYASPNGGAVFYRDRNPLDELAALESENADQKRERESTRDRLAQLESENADLRARLSEAHRQIGLLEGKLEASEMAGVVEGWRERAEKAEADNAALRTERDEAESLLKRIDKAIGYDLLMEKQDHAEAILSLRTRAEKAEAELKRLLEGKA